MPNGKIGDHPLTDIIIHNRPTFSKELDDLIRRINQLGGRQQLNELCDWFHPPGHSELEAHLKSLLGGLEARGSK